jgi:hypothetical protein
MITPIYITIILYINIFSLIYYKQYSKFNIMDFNSDSKTLEPFYAIGVIRFNRQYNNDNNNMQFNKRLKEINMGLLTR